VFYSSPSSSPWRAAEGPRPRRPGGRRRPRRPHK